MKILFLAPQPFYQERGTPIAVRLAIETIVRDCNRVTTDGEVVRLLTYAEGEHIQLEGTKIERVGNSRFLKGIGPGVSVRKLAADFLLMCKTLWLLCKSDRKEFAVIHAVEEAVFIAALAKLLFGIPYIYDMDSSLSLQLTDQWRWLRPLKPLFEAIERFVISRALTVAPVCDALVRVAQRQGASRVVLLSDFSLLKDDSSAPSKSEIRRECGASEDSALIMYVGNLEAYQGVELLVDSFAKCVQRIPSARLGIVGGRAEHCSAIRARTMALGISSQVAVLGPRPVGHLKAFLEAADILAAPRIQGSNTPMKIYSYLHSGRPIVATNLPTHRQVLDPEVAILADPNVEAYAAGLSLALESPELRATLGTAAFERAIRCHSRESFVLQLRELYSKIPGCQHPGGAPLVPSTDDVTAEA